MSVEQKSDLKSFHAFVAEQLANGGAHLSPEQVLALWRDRVDTIAAVNEGLHAVAERRTKPLHEYKNDFESRHNISTE